MKIKIPFQILLSVLLAATTAQAQSTIDATNKYAYGANIGWVNARGDTTNGVVVGEYVCSGYAYAANVGWINFGGGTAANGVYYANNSATDFGVNQDGTGRLRGFAYGANIGWINFEDTGNPAVDLFTGELSGYAYSANCGWISLKDTNVVVFTDSIRRGLSTAGDGIPDAWKIVNFGPGWASNPLAAAGADPDGDGKSNLQEYKDGTNPNNPFSELQITDFSKAGAGSGQVSVTWTSNPPNLGYRYMVEINPDLVATWSDSGLGLITPSGGTTTSRNVNYSATQYFFRIRAIQTPLLMP